MGVTCSIEQLPHRSVSSLGTVQACEAAAVRCVGDSPLMQRTASLLLTCGGVTLEGCDGPHVVQLLVVRRHQPCNATYAHTLAAKAVVLVGSAVSKGQTVVGTAGRCKAVEGSAVTAFLEALVLPFNPTVCCQVGSTVQNLNRTTFNPTIRQGTPPCFSLKE